MNTTQSNIDTLKDIRSMMERSSRFISLSGWSGISAGVFALVGAWLAHTRIMKYYVEEYDAPAACPSCLRTELLVIAAAVFVAAFISATLFTFGKSKRTGVAIWGSSARRLLWNTLLPMIAGGVLIIKMMSLNQYDLIAAATLIFYGLALVNGSKYTMGEIRFLGYAQILTGFVCMLLPRYGIACWAFGFGILHIIYGFAMWWKYDRNS